MTSGDHPHRSIGGRATLARARWAIDEQRLPRRTARTDGISNLTLHTSQGDFGPRAINWRAPPIGMPSLDAPNLKLHSASIGESARRWEASGECTRGDPRIITVRRCGELLHCGDLSATESHRLQDRRGNIRDQRGEGRVEALRTATYQ